MRIPASIMEATRLELDVVVDVREDKGRIVIEPVRRASCDLSELVDGITAENRHDAADFGPAVGNEAW